ncbi:tripartite motif-containing protein 44 [Scleropages formosus]|uniref:Tripartite motif containing 44 n=1 Tax=Scleropages formosus TaxID=113540 RepID=A0A8C9TBY7_SCLFO|nr:tripartite motif-containing protein 44 [Scleropages formosus]
MSAAGGPMKARDDEELPQNDGTCDACEPDEAEPAAQLCRPCGFAFCAEHADRHRHSTRHMLEPYLQDDGGEGEEVGGAHEAEVGVAQGAAAGGDEAQDNGRHRDAVTVERLRCKEHGQEGSLYCRPDERIICVVCAVQGEHRGHEIITLREAYLWQKSKAGVDLLSSTQEMAEKIKSKWTSSELSTEQLEEYVNQQFDELHRLVRLEEQRTLHLVDLKEAFLTAQAAEKIAEITVHTERLQEEMAAITQQLGALDQAGEANPRQGAAPDVEPTPRPEPRREPPRDYGEGGAGSFMGHAP